MNNKIKHLEMIEDLIDRMAKNCLQLKGWGLTIISIIGAIFAKSTTYEWLIALFIPIIGFSFLDAKYLQTERKYKLLFEYIRNKKEEDIDFNLNANQIPDELLKKSKINKKKQNTEQEPLYGKLYEKTKFSKCLFSWTVIGFYGLIILAAVGLFITLIVMK